MRAKSVVFHSEMFHDSQLPGLGDHEFITTLYLGGKERMRGLMHLVRHGRLDLTPLLTHTSRLDQIVDAYKLPGERRDAVLRVAIRPFVDRDGNWAPFETERVYVSNK